MRSIQSVFAVVIFVSLAIAQSARAEILLPFPKGIIRPPTASELSRFEPEQCAHVATSPSIKAVCFGRGLFQKQVHVRAIQIQMNDGTTTFYVENDVPAVEMLKPVFEVLGPVGGTLAQRPIAEIGEAELEFDERGEVSRLTLSTLHFGSVQVSFIAQNP